MMIRRQLDPRRPHVGSPSIPSSARVSPFLNGIHEISAIPSTLTSTSAFDQLMLTILPDATPACSYTPVSAVTTDADPSTPFPTILAEHGTCLSSGNVTVDDASFTNILKVYSGPTASSRSDLITLLNSPQTFISAQEWIRAKTSGARGLLHAASRSWALSSHRLPSGSASSFYMVPPIQLNSPSRRASPHAIHETAGCALKSAFTPPYTDSLSSHPLAKSSSAPPTPMAFPLLSRTADEWATFTISATPAIEAFFLSSTPSRSFGSTSSGVPALTGNYLVDMLPLGGLSTDTEIFVTHGRQHIPLCGFTDLEPGDLLGTYSSSLVKTPPTNLHDVL